MRIPFLILTLLLGVAAASAQTAEIDSLKRAVERAQSDTAKGRTLCRLCLAVQRFGDLQQAEATSKEGLKLLKAAEDEAGLAECMISLGSTLSYTGNLKEALELFQQSLKLRERIDDRNGQASSLLAIGHVYYMLGNYPSALNNYEKSLAVFERLNNDKGIANLLQSMANVYDNLGDTPKAVAYYLKSMKRATPSLRASCLNNISVIYMQQGELDKALDCQRQSLEIYEKLNDVRGARLCYSNMANVYVKRKDFKKARSYYEKNIEFCMKGGDPGGASVGLTSLGNLSYATGNFAEALKYFDQSLRIKIEAGDQEGISWVSSLRAAALVELGRAREARASAEKGLRIAQEIGHLHWMAYGAKSLYRSDSALGDWKSAFYALKLHIRHSDSLTNSDKSREIGRLESKYEYEKQAEIERNRVEEEMKREAARTNWMLGSAGGGLLLLLIVAFTLFRGRRKEKRANTQLRALNDEISQQKAEIESMNAELQATLDTIKHQHEQIEDSIHYASRIQHAILPSAEQLQAALPAHFIHYQPRDIVSGDFYWTARFEGKVFFAAVDCTGHGVPGAFMSVVGHNLLNQVVNETGITRPAAILKALDRRITQALRQQFGGDSKDGMDVALVVLHEADDAGNRVVEFAGAGRPLWTLRGGEFSEYKSAKYACGGSQHEAKEFPAHRIEIKRGDRLYLFSDGVTDQFGGPQGRKLGSAKLQAHLLETSALPVETQGKAFADFFAQWMGKRKQLDDVLLAGVEV